MDKCVIKVKETLHSFTLEIHKLKTFSSSLTLVSLLEQQIRNIEAESDKTGLYPWLTIKDPMDKIDLDGLEESSEEIRKIVEGKLPV